MVMKCSFIRTDPDELMNDNIENLHFLIVLPELQCL
jgi:hypothetical protein